MTFKLPTKPIKHTRGVFVIVEDIRRADAVLIGVITRKYNEDRELLSTYFDRGALAIVTTLQSPHPH